MSRQKIHDGCGLWFCQEPKHYARNRCARHYQNWLRTGIDICQRPSDLAYVLDTVDTMRGLFRELLADPLRVISDTESECNFCHKVSPVQPTHVFEQDLLPALHEATCPSLRAYMMLLMTESTPMDEDEDVWIGEQHAVSAD